jgi:hypothetical protein
MYMDMLILILQSNSIYLERMHFMKVRGNSAQIIHNLNLISFDLLNIVLVNTQSYV